jgi:hypothetical protein
MTATAEETLRRAEAALIVALDAVRLARSEVGQPAQPAPPEWVTVPEAAFRLGISETATWENAKRYGANWPASGVRRVNFSILKQIRPPRA